MIAASAEAKVAAVTPETRAKAGLRRDSRSSRHRKASSRRLSQGSNNRPNPLSKRNCRRPRRNVKAKDVVAAAAGVEVAIALNVASALSARKGTARRQRRTVRKVERLTKMPQCWQALPRRVVESLRQPR